MSDGSFADYMTRERERLHAEREAVFTQQQALETKLNEINREFAAIEAYEAAKSGKAVRGMMAGSGKRAPRQARRGSRREGIIETLKGATEGLSRGELLERLGLKGDKSGEMSVSNALTALTKAGAVMRNAAKKYVVGA